MPVASSNCVPNIDGWHSSIRQRMGQDRCQARHISAQVVDRRHNINAGNDDRKFLIARAFGQCRRHDIDRVVSNLRRMEGDFLRWVQLVSTTSGDNPFDWSRIFHPTEMSPSIKVMQQLLLSVCTSW